MKISKSAASTARRLFRFCLVDGKLDRAKVLSAASHLATEKPRDFRGILGAFQRLVRFDEERRKVLVESAIELDAATRQRVLAGLTKQYGVGLSAEYKVNSELLGGLRIRVGDDVIDGSVQGRLERLMNAF